VVVVAGVVSDAEGAEASLRGMLAAALEANQEMARLVAELREENARLRAENVRQAVELENLQVELAVFQRMLFGRSSERSGPEPDSGAGDAGRGEERQGGPGGSGKKRGPGARAGRRDYSHLPRVEVIWDFDGGGYCCPEC
jgi:transposase